MADDFLEKSLIQLKIDIKDMSIQSIIKRLSEVNHLLCAGNEVLNNPNYTSNELTEVTKESMETLNDIKRLIIIELKKLIKQLKIIVNDSANRLTK